MTDPSPQPNGERAPIRADIAHRTAGERRRRRLVGLAVAAVCAVAALFLALWVWRFAFSDLPAVPDKAALWSLNRPPGATFLDRSGRIVGRRGPYHGPPLALADLPAYVPRAFLAAEDRNFYSHPGVDLVGMIRAARNDLRGRGEALQGGSTITQQLARTLFLSPEQSLKRKVQEAALALLLERRLTKTEILELYLNRIYFGGGAFGLQAAAQTYFGKPAPALSLSEAALLAALPKAPSRLSPKGYGDALSRSRSVLRAMAAAGWISPAAARDAAAAPPILVRTERSEGDFGYVFDIALREARGVAPSVPDLVIRLTADLELQTLAARAVREAAAAGASRGATQGALVALAPDGAILALVGGVDHRLSPFDRATQALRQPGSAFKPFVYAAALEAGLTPDDVRTDAPIRIGAWRPENIDGAYAGAVTLRTALERSLNTVAVRVGQEVGWSKVAALARRFGLSSIPADAAPPVTLGAYEVPLLDLAAAYQVFQSGGFRRAPYLVRQIENARGDVLWRRTVLPPETVYAPDRAASMVAMLKGVVADGTGRKADIGRPAAGKTGTSQDYRDAWFVGFTPDLLAAVWLGDDQDRPMDRVVGGDLPAKAWSSFMSAALAGAPARDFAPEAAISAGREGRGGAAADPRAAVYRSLALSLEAQARGEPAPGAPGADEAATGATAQPAAPPPASAPSAEGAPSPRPPDPEPPPRGEEGSAATKSRVRDSAS